MSSKAVLTWNLLVVIGLALAGCNKADFAKDKGAPAAQVPAASHGHEEWWCSEHGVPESVCGQCSTKLAEGFKAKGDWCKQHDCPESQCFVCHPEFAAKFAAQYEAKFGKAPPKPN